jgi:hypothetical protein
MDYSKSTTNKHYVYNGLRYPLVGGTRRRRFAGTNFKPRKVPENAQTPITTPAPACGASVTPMLVGDRVHAVLAGVFDFMRQFLDGFLNLFILGNKWIQLSQTR